MGKMEGEGEVGSGWWVPSGGRTCTGIPAVHRIPHRNKIALIESRLQRTETLLDLEALVHLSSDRTEAG